MILYNFCQRIVQEIKNLKKDNRKYEYQINFTRSFHILRHFLRKTGRKPPPIGQEILPIRPSRTDTRYVKAKTVVFFNYRYD